MPLKTIDIHGANAHATYSKSRTACRGVVIQDSRILISHELNTDVYMIPGGGVEEGESATECVIRELREESGYIIEPRRHFLTMNEYYEDCKYVSHYFICDIVGEAEQSLTDGEIARGLCPEWMELDEILGIFSRHSDYASSDEEKRGIYFREYTALTEYAEQNRRFL